MARVSIPPSTPRNAASLIAATAARASLVVTCLLLGCSADVEQAPGLDANQAIVGGTQDTVDASVALIRFVITDESGAKKNSNCTGSLVAPDVVLTAGHCVKGFMGKTMSEWTVSFDAKTKNGVMANPIAVEKAVPHPDFNGLAGGSSDVALLFLEQGQAPESLRPMPIAGTLGNVVGEELTLVGYGAVGASPDGSKLIGGNDLRRKVTVRASAKSDTYIEYLGDKGLCGGDSGGPTLMTIDGVAMIVGINDLVGAGCTGNGASVRVDADSGARAFLDANLPSGGKS